MMIEPQAILALLTIAQGTGASNELAIFLAGAFLVYVLIRKKR
jgi:hypothetical protein